jgi:hypothetical protein
MAITVAWYGQGLLRIMQQQTNTDLEVADLFLALVTNAYTPDRDAHDFWNDVVTNELAAGGGYTTNGADVTGAALSYDSGTDQVRLDIADVSWTFTAAKTWRYGVLYERTSGTDATRQLFALLTWDSDQTVSTAYTLTIDAAGLIGIDTT